MDPQKKSFQLCELASCTDLPVFEDVRQELFLPAKPPSSGDDDYESLETSSDCSFDSSDDPNGIQLNIPNGVSNDICHAKKVLTPEMVNLGIKVMSYAVRGPLAIRAVELEKEIKAVRASFYTKNMALEAKCHQLCYHGV